MGPNLRPDEVTFLKKVTQADVILSAYSAQSDAGDSDRVITISVRPLKKLKIKYLGKVIFYFGILAILELKSIDHLKL